MLTYEQWHQTLTSELEALSTLSSTNHVLEMFAISQRIALLESQLKMPKLFYTLYCYYEQAREGRRR